MKQIIKRLFILFTLILVVGFFLYQVQDKVLAEQSGSSPESGVTSRIKTIYDSLVSLTHGSESAGGWGDWGVMWNRIRSAGEWKPSGDASASDVLAGKVFYKDSRTPVTGSLTLTGDALASEVISGKTFYSNSFTKLTGTAPAPFDYSTESKVTWDDYENDGSAEGDNAGEESVWTNIAGGATTGIWKDTRTDLYWSSNQGYFTNSFTIATCDFYTSDPRGSYNGSDANCGNAINHCANLSLDADGDSVPETNWYLPTQKELMHAYLNGIYNQTNTAFVTTNFFWSSTEVSFNANSAWFIGLYTGYTSDNGKAGGYAVRCVARD